MVLPIAALLMGMGVRSRMKEEDRAAEDQAYANDQRNAWREDRKRTVDMRKAVSDAAAPVTPESGEVYQPAVDDEGNAMPANPTAGTFKVAGQRFGDQASADTAAAAANTPQAQTARMSDAMLKYGDPTGAQALRTGGLHEQAAKLTLDKAQREHANKMFNDTLAPLASHDEIAETLNKGLPPGSPRIKAMPSPDGKKTTYGTVAPDGTITATQHVYDNTPRGLLLAKQDAMKDIPIEHQLTTMHQLALEQHQTDQLASQTEHQKGMLGVAQQNADTQEGWRRDQAAHFRNMEAIARAKGPNGEAPLWDDKADAFLKSRYTVKDETTGATSVDGDGLQFAKAIALAQAKRNGGDTTSALGYAFDLDNKIKADAKGDPTAMRAGRAKILQALMTPKVAPGPQPPQDNWIRTAPMGTVVRPAPAAPVASMSSAVPQAPAQADPLAAQLAQENVELNKGARFDYSPEVKAYVQAQREQESAASAAGNAAYKERERTRAVATSKQNLGR